MEDLMEEIVGEIRDESEPELDVVEQPDHSFIADGNVDLDRLEELVDFRPDEEFETTTIGGLVCEQLGHVPSPGAKIQLDGIEIEVLTADERRVNRVRVRRLPPAKDEGADTDDAADQRDRKGAA
jgi:CBS domain containing-hemolysin-like protein